MSQGYVYLIEAGGACSGLYKIGKAVNPHKRIKQIVKMPFPIKLIHAIQCNNAGYVESELHRFLKSLRANGEWFGLTKDRVDAIISCSSESDVLEMISAETKCRDDNEIVGAGHYRLCLKEVSEQKGLNMSQIQRGAQLDMGMVRRYWYNQTSSVDLRAIEKIMNFFATEGMPIAVSDLFTVTQEPQP